MENETIELGDYVTDTVSCFEGVAIAETRWLNGCVRFTLQPRGLHEGKLLPCETFDVQQLRLMSKGEPRKPSETGGPIPTPTRTTAIPR